VERTVVPRVRRSAGFAERGKHMTFGNQEIKPEWGVVRTFSVTR